MDAEYRKNNWFIIIIIVSSVIAIAVSFYFFYVQKNYDFKVETSCDPQTEACFYRDCDTVGTCPPNNISYYKTYTIKANDFDQCAGEDCKIACDEKKIQCKQDLCTEEDFDAGSCVLPTPQTKNQ